MPLLWAPVGLSGSINIVLNGVGVVNLDADSCAPFTYGGAPDTAAPNVTAGGHARYSGVIILQPGGV